MRTFTNTASNLNQIAVKAHTLGFIDTLTLDRMIEKLNNFIDNMENKYLINEKGNDEK